MIEVLLRWLSLLALLLALGGLPFAICVWRPAWRASRDSLRSYDADDARMGNAIRRLTLGGAVGLLGFTLLDLLAQQAGLIAVAPGDPLVTQQSPAIAGNYRLLAMRMLGAVLLGGLVWRLPAHAGGAAWRFWLGLLPGALLIASFSLQSHIAAATQSRPLAVAADCLHLAATVAWLGGLPPLLVAIMASRRDRRHTLPLIQLITRFGGLALLAIFVLAATGIYSYSLHLAAPDLAALAATGHGQAFIAKLVLVLPLLLFSWISLRLLLRRLRRSGNRLALALSQSVRIELALALVILFLVSVMLSSTPGEIAGHDKEPVVLGAVDQPSVDVDPRSVPREHGAVEFEAVADE